MNKGQLIEAVASELGESKAEASRALVAVINCITKGVKRDQSVTIVGFGTFTKKIRSARTGRNPATGQPMQIKASTTVGFKAGDRFRPHLTLCRFRKPSRIARTDPVLSLPGFPVSRVVLMRSTLTQRGAQHAEVAAWTLQRR